MDAELESIVAFVEGRISPKDFEKLLEDNPRFEEVLSSTRVKFAAEGIDSTTYLYVIEQNLSDSGSILNVQDVLVKHLAKEGILCNPTDRFRMALDLVLSSQPKWLDIDPEFFEQEILAGAGERKGAVLKKWIREKILQRFRYVSRPPKWIQNPEWPINDNGPMVFLGQINFDAPEYFHDSGAAYIFLDPKPSKKEVVIQLY